MPCGTTFHMMHPKRRAVVCDRLAIVHGIQHMACDGPLKQGLCMHLRAGVVVALVIVQKDRHALRRDNNSFHNATLYADRHTCPNFLDPGQATLASDRTPTSEQPNILEELTVPEIAAVRFWPL